MFGFGRSTKDPLSDVRSATRWIATLPGADSLAVHTEVVKQLDRVADAPAALTLNRMRAVFHVDAQTGAQRRALVAQYVEHASRSSRIENQLWTALFRLTQSFLAIYQALAREIVERPQSARWQELMPELLCRQIVHLALDARVRLFRYEQWIPAKWAELHGLMTLACSRQCERQIVTLADAATTTIEHEYLRALVLQLMSAGSLTARQVEFIWGELDDWCAPLRLTLEPSAANSFFVDLAGREGLRRRKIGPLESRVLFLDTRPLHAVMMQHVVTLEQKIRAEPLSSRTPRRSEQLTLFAKLAAQVDPEFKPFARRGERVATSGNVDAIVGFQKITSYFREDARQPIDLVDSTGESFDSTMDIAVFGRIRDEPTRRREIARRRIGAHAAPGGPWEAKDVSQTGFKLVAPIQVANAVTLGTLVAIHPHGQPRWSLGIIRRMKRTSADRAEIGLAIVADTISAVDVNEQRKRTVEEYSIDGDGTTINGRRFGGLLLSLRARDGEPMVQSLIVPAVEYQATKRYQVATEKAEYRIRFGRLIEQQPDWVWTAIEPLDGSARAPAPVASGPTTVTGMTTVTGITVSQSRA
jgi:cyclic-di-GMP-binding protein